MNLYLLRQDENEWYDTYDSCIVVAESEEEAVQISPAGVGVWAPSPDHVACTLIGKAVDNIEHDNGIVLASFNAG